MWADAREHVEAVGAVFEGDQGVDDHGEAEVVHDRMALLIGALHTTATIRRAFADASLEERAQHEAQSQRAPGSAQPTRTGSASAVRRPWCQGHRLRTVP